MYLAMSRKRILLVKRWLFIFRVFSYHGNNIHYAYINVHFGFRSIHFKMKILVA